jgi:hypothetical protein
MFAGFSIAKPNTLMLPAFAVSEGIVKENTKPGSKLNNTNPCVREYEVRKTLNISPQLAIYSSALVFYNCLTPSPLYSTLP